MKITLKEQAIRLRKSGKTYSEIAHFVPVSKATLSLWLRDVETPPEYEQKVQALRLKAREKGWEARRNERLGRIALIDKAAPGEVSRLLNDPLWLVGLTLYWAEGSKEKPWSQGTPITFTNMDVETILLFKLWALKFLHITSDDFSHSLYVHDTQAHRCEDMRKWWAEILSVPTTDIKIYFKRSKITHVRHNDNEEYRGVFRLNIKKSVDMNRRMSAWTRELVTSLKSSNFVR